MAAVMHAAPLHLATSGVDALRSGTVDLLASIPSPPFRDLTIGPFSFRMYGLMIALGVLAAVWIARRRFASYGGDPEDITTVALVAVPAGLVGARLYHVVTDFSTRYSDGRWWPDAFMVWKGGLGIPGGVLFGAIAGVLVARRLKIDWRLAADACAPAIPVAQAIGRLGNWFNQELYGRPTSLPWGLRIDAEPGVLFHPTFLYELLWNLALAGLIAWGSGRVVLRRGRWLAVYIAGYGLGRLWVEALRSDEATHVLGLRVNIWTSLVAIVGGLLWLFWRGSPVDREATERLRAGETMAQIVGGVGVRPPFGADDVPEHPAEESRHRNEQDEESEAVEESERSDDGFEVVEVSEPSGDPSERSDDADAPPDQPSPHR